MIEVRAFFFKQAIGDLAHAPGDDGDGGVGFLAPRTVPLVEGAEVGRATDCHPGAFDKGPTQPLVAGP